MKNITIENKLIENDKDRAIEVAIRNYSRQAILAIVAKKELSVHDVDDWRRDFLSENELILDQIAALSGEDGFQRIYTKAIRRGIKLFSEELIKYMREQNAAGLPRYSRLPYGQERVKHPANILAEVLISSSPSLFSALDSVQKIEIATAFERVPNLDSHFRDNILGELVLSLAFAKGDYIFFIFNEIQDKFKQAPVAEQIAIGRTIYSLGISAINSGYESGLESARHYSGFLWHLSEATDSTFVQLMMGNLARKIDHEYDQENQVEIEDLEYLGFLDFARKRDVVREKAVGKYNISSKDRGPRESVRVLSSDYVGLYGEGRNLLELAPREKNLKFSDTQKIFSNPENIPFGSSQSGDDVRYIYEQMQDWLCRASIEDTLNVELEKLPLRSQIQLINYLVNCKEESFDSLFRLVKDGQVSDDFYQAFFAQNADVQSTTTLIESVQKYGIEIVGDICKKYNKLIDEITKVESMVGNFFADKTRSEVDARRAVQEFSKRAADILFKAAKNPERADEFFASATKDILMFSSIFKAAVKMGVEFKLEDVAGLDVTSFKGSELPEEIRTSLKEITAANWLVRGEVGKNVVGGFNSVVDQGGTERMWHILRRGNEVVSFVRFDGIQKSGDEQLHEYAGSFNVHPAYRGSAIGEAMMNEVLIEESRRAVLHATMDPRIDVGTRYVEDIGFLVTGVAENYLDTTESFFEITADQAALGNFASRGWTREQALTFARERARESLAVQAERGDVIVASVTRDAGAEPEFIAGAAEILRAGFVGTRYLSEGEGSKVRYMIFEKLK